MTVDQLFLAYWNGTMTNNQIISGLTDLGYTQSAAKKLVASWWDRK